MSTTSPPDKLLFRRKVDDLLAEAMSTDDDFVRAKLLGKAVYWNTKAMTVDPHIKLVRGRPVPIDPSSDPKWGQ